MKHICSVIVFCFLVWAGVLASIGNVAGSAAVSASAFLCLVALNIDRIQSFKGAGMEAQMRETLGEANEALRSLRAIMAPMASLSYSLLSRSGRMGVSYTPAERDVVDANLLKQLQGLGLGDEETKMVRSEYLKYISIDYRLAAVHVVFDGLISIEKVLGVICSGAMSNPPISADQARGMLSKCAEINQTAMDRS